MQTAVAFLGTYFLIQNNNIIHFALKKLKQNYIIDTVSIGILKRHKKQIILLYSSSSSLNSRQKDIDKIIIKVKHNKRRVFKEKRILSLSLGTCHVHCIITASSLAHTFSGQTRNTQTKNLMNDKPSIVLNKVFYFYTRLLVKFDSLCMFILFVKEPAACPLYFTRRDLIVACQAFSHSTTQYTLSIFYDQFLNSELHLANTKHQKIFMNECLAIFCTRCREFFNCVSCSVKCFKYF